MFTEVIDILRCPHPHDDSWLVASSTATVGRHIVSGRLGCPVCKATFEIVEAEARFGGAEVAATDPALDDGAAFRLAAQLYLVEAPAPVLLTGHWACAVSPLLRLMPQLSLLTGDATCVIPIDDRVSAMRLPDSVLPVAARSLRGVALGSAHASEAFVQESARVLRTGGRLVAPAGVALDAVQWRLLATDEQVQVAERLPAPSAPVELKRAPSQPLFIA